MNTQLLQVSITTRDMNKLVQFYSNVFDFIPVSNWVKPDLGLKAIKLQRPEIILEITESNKINSCEVQFSMHKEGLNMIAFVVRNIKDVLDKVVDYGGRLHTDTINGNTVKSVTFITDPEGNGIELIEEDISKPIEFKPVITKYIREELWSTGRLTPDLYLFIQFAKQGGWRQYLLKEQIDLVVKKAGDIAGCPIPDKVAANMGELQALIYLTSLSELYIILKDIFRDTNLNLAGIWGKDEKRDVYIEPWGEDCSRVPTKVRSKDLLRGPGKYQEFSITRLLWIDQQESFLSKKLGLNKMREIIKKVNTLDELQVSLLAEVASVRSPFDSIEKLAEVLSKGIAHEGFFKQNNSYKQVKRVYKLLKEGYEKESWFPPLEEKIISILNSPITKYS